MTATTLRRFACMTAVVLAVTWTGRGAHAQIQPPPSSAPPLARLAFPEVHAALKGVTPGARPSVVAPGVVAPGVVAPATAAPVAPVPVTLVHPLAPAPSLAEGYPYFAVGLRAGSFFLTDADAEDAYGVLPVLGLDVKIHLWKLPLAVQTSFDWMFGSGEVEGDVDGNEIQDSDSDITLYSWRLSLILEAPPGAFGTTGGDFYLQPYIGGGVGIHLVDQEITGETTVGEISESANESVVGYHALAGVDFVFVRIFSVGVEAFWATARTEDALDEHIDAGGFGGTITIRIHF